MVVPTHNQPFRKKEGSSEPSWFFIQFSILAENYLDLVNAAVANRNYASLNSLAVECE